MHAHIQIVGRLPIERSRQVRAAAKRQKVTVNACLIEALTRVVAPHTLRRVRPTTTEDA